MKVSVWAFRSGPHLASNNQVTSSGLPSVPDWGGVEGYSRTEKEGGPEAAEASSAEAALPLGLGGAQPSRRGPILCHSPVPSAKPQFHLLKNEGHTYPTTNVNSFI